VESDDDDVVGQRAARQTGARPTRNEGEIGFGEGFYDGNRLVARSGKDSELRLASISGESVGIVDQQLTGPAEYVSLAYDVG
jgi:hypothetical protein